MYFCVMNGQLTYIVHASLLLIVSAGVVLFLQKLPSINFSAKEEPWCAVESPQQVQLTEKAQRGKTLFMSKCASCHHIFRNATGPSLSRFTEREPWTNRQNVYDWIRNPAAFMKNNEYASDLFRQYGTMMQAFPDITNEEIDTIVEYLNQ